MRVSSITHSLLEQSGGYAFEAVKFDPQRPRKITDKPTFKLVGGF